MVSVNYIIKGVLLGLFIWLNHLNVTPYAFAAKLICAATTRQHVTPYAFAAKLICAATTRQQESRKEVLEMDVPS